MESQTPLIQQTQHAVKQNRSRLFIVMAIILLVVLGSLYVYQDTQQAKRAQEITAQFSTYLDQGQYTQGHTLIAHLEDKGLGRHLPPTQAAVNQLLQTKIEQISVDITAEQENLLTTYQKQKGIQVFRDYQGAKDAFEQEILKKTDAYFAQQLDISQITYFYKNILLFGFADTLIQQKKEIVQLCQQSRENTAQGLRLQKEGKFFDALDQFAKVTQEDQKTYQLAQQGLQQVLNRLDTRIEKLGQQGQYIAAIDSLNKLKALFPENTEISKKITAIETARKEEEKNLVLYEGAVQHIFFHPLIAFPELTFDGDLQSRGFNEWFVTVDEFKKMMASIYEKGFILIDFDDLYEVKKVDDREIIQQKKLHLPKGKKPMILSIDDMNYYRYMIQNGTVHKLILDQEEKVATYSKTSTGEDLISYDNGIVPILDRFVEEHPDFSFHGAKGVIALTGYEGILGYRTDERDAPNFAKEKEAALQVVRVLKDNGWSFASHGYGHLNTREASFDRMKRDTEKWQQEVQALIGQTDVFIYPFGAWVKPEDLKFKSLQESGFKVFCSVGPNPYLKFSEKYMLMDRRHIDGVALFWQADSMRDLFESEEIIDPVRPLLTK